jgi:acetolactate synthase-1/2/3 large subunit
MGPAVLLVAKDFQRAAILAPQVDSLRLASTGPTNHEIIRRAADTIEPKSVLIVAGAEVARTGAWWDLARLADVLEARVAVAPDARDAFDNRHPRFVGVAGAMGHPAVAIALAEARCCLLVGTRLSVLTRQGLEALLLEKRVISLGCGRPYVGPAEMLHIEGDLRAHLRALASEIALGRHGSAQDAVPRASDSARNADVACARGAPPKAGQPVAPGPPHASSRPSSDAGADLCLRSVMDAVTQSLPEGSVVLVDAGNTGASSIHYVNAPRDGHWLVAMGMAGMGYCFGAAVGAALATGRRCTVLAGDGAFFMQGLDIHTAVEHDLPITYVILDNSAHGMCLVRERLLLGENAGYNAFHRSRIGAGVAAMFPRLLAKDCRTQGELAAALSAATARRGPTVIAVQLPEVEIPPFAAFQLRGGAPRTVSRGLEHENC